MSQFLTFAVLAEAAIELMLWPQAAFMATLPEAIELPPASSTPLSAAALGA